MAETKTYPHGRRGFAEAGRKGGMVSRGGPREAAGGSERVMEQQTAKFDGWAVLEVFGHQRFAGYVTTEAYGQAVLFRIDVPELKARARTTKSPGYCNGDYCPAGTVVQEGAVAGYTKLFGAGAIYAITPCTEAAALEAVEEMQRRPVMKLTLPERPALPASGVIKDGAYLDPVEDDEDDEDSEL